MHSWDLLSYFAISASCEQMELLLLLHNLCDFYGLKGQQQQAMWLIKLKLFDVGSVCILEKWQIHIWGHVLLWDSFLVCILVLLDSLKLGVSLLQYLPVCSEATEFLKIHKKGSFIVKGESGRAGFCYCILK